MGIEPLRLHISLKSLRRGVVEITTEEEDPTGIWIEDSGIVSLLGSVIPLSPYEFRKICAELTLTFLFLACVWNNTGSSES
jgi:hypothetical protein